MAYFNDTINILRPLFKSKDKDVATLSNSQTSFGCLVENNLIRALDFCKEKNHIRVQKTNDVYDTLFGADAMIEFLCPMNFRLDHLSVYVDVTLENKPNKVRFNKDKPLCKLDNGLEFAIAFKPNHSGFFKYRKPIIILELRSEGYGSLNRTNNKAVRPIMPNQMLLVQPDIFNPSGHVERIWPSPVEYKRVNPIFSENDIAKIVKYLRQASLYLSYDLNYEYQGEIKRGTCKYASTEIDLNKDMMKSILESGGIYNDNNTGLSKTS